MKAVILAALMLPGAALAQDRALVLEAERVTIYPDMAVVEMAGALALPAGTHRLLATLPGGEMGANRVPFDITGGSLLQMAWREAAITDPEAHFSAPQSQAKAALDRAKAALDTAKAAHDSLKIEVIGLNEELAFLASVRADALNRVVAAELAQTGQMLREEIMRARRALLALEPRQKAAQKAEETAQQAVFAAQAAFDRLSPPESGDGALEITLRTDGTAPVEVRYSTAAGLSWQPSYVATLSEETGVLEVERLVEITADAAPPMIDVDLVLATNLALGQVDPSQEYPDRARLEGPMPKAEARALSSAAAPGPAILAEAAPIMDTSGPAVTYSFPNPVTLAADGTTRLAFDSFAMTATLSNRAAPRQDDTAFLVASVENTRAEPLLPGVWRLYRDSALIGETRADLIPAGGAFEMGFGRQEHLRLGRVVLNNSTGERGVFRGAEVRTQALELSVENLGAETETVDLRYALPFAEEEALEVNVSAKPAPDATDVDQKRGVSSWVMDVAPGEKAIVALQFDFRWPEGQDLRWWP